MIRVTGHFGEWLQGRLGPDGPLVLVTLPCSALAITVAGTDPLLRAATRDRFAHALGHPLPETGLRSDMPLGAGAGASTAALIALARAAGGGGDAESLAQACLAAEGATDPLMFEAPDALLWAPRAARALARLPPMPPAEIVGGFWGPPTPTDPADIDFPDIADLVALWRTADGDLAACAGLAAESARRCTARRGPSQDPVPDLAAALGALGHTRAHTGSARGLVFAPGTAPARCEALLAEAGLGGTLRFATGGAG
jgi:uncharacterized protein involved in propanediol utilization